MSRNCIVRRSPDLILAGATGILILRAALWLTTSNRVASFIVVTLFPAWVALELSLFAGVCAYGLSIAGRRPVYLFGQPIDRRTSAPLALVGLAVLLLEAALWFYGAGIV